MDKLPVGRNSRLISAVNEVVQKKAEEVQSFQDAGIENLAQQASDDLDVFLNLKMDLKKDEKKKPFVSNN